MNDQERKRKVTNLVGLGVLACLLFGIGVQYVWVESYKWGTQTILDQLAKGFADNNRITIRKWVGGMDKDEWGRQITIHRGVTHIRFVSGGPDGNLETTEDNLVSDWVVPSDKKEAQEALGNKYVEPPAPPKKGWFDWLKFW